MEKITIFTDGACQGNPGPGGWGAVLRKDNEEIQLSGFSPNTTNNRMELLAAIEALASLKTPHKVSLTTDSQYVQRGITEWVASWKRRGWKTASKQPVKNQDLWMRLDALSQTHEVDWQWVRGHTGHEGNELADSLACAAIKANN